MTSVFISMVLALQGQPAASAIQQRSLRVPELERTLLYGISIPNDYDSHQAVPLVLALHPGANGRPTPYYGSVFMRQIFGPALNGLRPIIVAPDCLGGDWTDPVAEKSVLALLKSVLDEYAIDRRRILVTGFSMGGHGTWFMESRHADLFTAAIIIAGSARSEPLERLATIPTYVIHSRDDQVVPFEPAQRTAEELEKMGRPLKFEALEGLGHFEMGGYINAIRRAGQWVAERWAK